MRLDSGSYLGPYQIISDLGKGGMGEVYRAKDIRLERQVAIKVLSENLAGNEKALKRFEREAKTLAALSHPNIVAIYDIGRDRGITFVAMELLEGETLRKRLDTSALGWRRALEIASVMADALAAAHSKGVTHRDLKPENIFLSPNGSVKILDFGLARVDQMSTPDQLTAAITGPLATESGTILGTVQYMSPEQARGQTVDNRADIWAFGCLLYEMLTGHRAFQGSTFPDVIASVLLKEPSYTDLPQDLPANIQQLLKRCLEKEPNDRMDDVTAIKSEIDKALLGTITLSISKSLRKSRAPKKRMRSLAVLPFTNLSRDPDKEYFADGMTEALISSLARLGALRIISRTSAMTYKGSTKSLPEIAQELNVDTVLEGSVLQIGQRVRITVQLISAATDTHLWAEDYDRDLQDVLLLQSEVAQAVAKKIQVTVTEEDAKRLQSARKVNPEAYENYLKARYHLFKGSPENLEAASGYLRVAIAKDPKFAGAYSAMADLQLQRSMRGYVPSSESISKAKEAIQMALQIDDSQPEVHISLGIFKFGFEWDWDGALQEYEKAIRLNPNIAEVHFFYADCLISLKRDPQRWKEEMDQALALDPLNSFIQCMYGWNLIYLQKYDEAIAQLNKALLIEPNFSSAHMGLWGAFYKKQMHEQALNEAKKFFTIIHDYEIVEALNASKDYQEAMSKAAGILAERSTRTHVPAIRIARLYAHAREKEQTLQWLEKSYQQREMPLFHLNVGWDWDDVRDDSRFQTLLREMKLI